MGSGQIIDRKFIMHHLFYNADNAFARFLKYKVENGSFILLRIDNLRFPFDSYHFTSYRYRILQITQFIDQSEFNSLCP